MNFRYRNWEYSMQNFRYIIHEYKAKFTRFSMIIASLATFFLSFYSGLEGFSILSLSLITCSVTFGLCAFFLCNSKNYKISASILVLCVLALISYTLTIFEIPIVAGAIVFMPMIIAAATFLLGSRVGLVSLVYCLTLIGFTHWPEYEALDLVGFDGSIWIDRIISCFCTYSVAAMSPSIE